METYTILDTIIQVLKGPEPKSVLENAALYSLVSILLSDLKEKSKTDISKEIDSIKEELFKYCFPEKDPLWDEPEKPISLVDIANSVTLLKLKL